jgi:hypothetical protein
MVSMATGTLFSKYFHHGKVPNEGSNPKGETMMKKSRVVIAGLAFALISVGVPASSQASVQQVESAILKSAPVMKDNSKNSLSAKSSVKPCLKPKPQYPPKPRPKPRSC